jgi:hypothetical protein
LRSHVWIILVPFFVSRFFETCKAVELKAIWKNIEVRKPVMVDTNYRVAEIFVAWDENDAIAVGLSEEEALGYLHEETSGNLVRCTRLSVKLPVPVVEDAGEIVVPA